VNSERHARITEVFLAVADLPVTERPRALRELCGGDEEMRREVERLLAHDETAAGLDQGVAALEGAHAAAAMASGLGAAPKRIKDYEIVGTLGQGGMGTVYRARQANPSRLVALKVINPAILTAELVRRFEFEAQVLAQVHHPGIAEIYEAGTATIHGVAVPFFAMELVEGEMLTAHATRRGLGLRERLELLRKVCLAVQHAHQKGVIHRDLKPGNILVTEGGEPKILDFGVARTTTQAMQNRTLMTQVGQIVGTLAYMSPEQISGDPQAIDLRSDIYALGVIGYELLAGKLPVEVGTRSLADAVRTISQPKVEPLGRVRGDCRGDVEIIIGRAMATEPARRYASAAELAREIERFLTGEAIEARRDSRSYVLRKAIARHRTPVAIAGIFMLALGVTAIVAVTYAVREARQRHLTERVSGFQGQMLAGLETRAMGAYLRERLRAQAEAALRREYIGEWPQRRLRTEEEVAAELAVFDGAVRPGPTADAARAMLDHFVLEPAARTMKEQFADEPGARAHLQGALAGIYFNLGDHQAALDLVDEAREIAGENPIGAAREAEDLEFLRARALQRLDRLTEAEEGYREALRMHGQGGQGPDRRTAEIRGSLAVVLKSRGDFEGARGEFEGTIALLRSLPEEAQRTEMLARALANFGDMLQAEGALKEGEAALLESVQTCRAMEQGDEHTLAMALNNLANLYLTSGRADEALPLEQEALAIFQRLLGDEHPDALDALHNLADMQRLLGLLDEAQTSLMAVINAERRAGRSAQSIGASMTVLGLIMQQRGDYAGSEPIFREVAETFRALGEEHPDYAKSLNSLAAALHLQGKITEAEPLYRQALAIRLRTPGAEHVDVATMHNNLAAILRDTARFAEADEEYGRAVALFRRVGPDHMGLPGSLAGWGRVKYSLGQYAEAEARLREALGMLQERLPAGHPQALVTAARLGRALTGLARYDEARTLLDEAYAGLKDGPAGGELALTVEAQVELYEKWNAAEPTAERGEKAAQWRATLDALHG